MNNNAHYIYCLVSSAIQGADLHSAHGALVYINDDSKPRKLIK